MKMKLGVFLCCLMVPLLVVAEPLWSISGLSQEQGEPTSNTVQANTKVLATLSVGQQLTFILPQETSPLQRTIRRAHEQLSGRVRVWLGPNVTIVQGAKATYVTVATETEVYEVEIDNETGLGSIVSESDMMRGKEENDFIIAPPITPEEQSLAEPVKAAGPHRIDVLGVYPNHVNVADPEALFVSRVTYANRALQLSGVDYQYRLVKVAQMNWDVDNTVSGTVLSSLARDPAVLALRERWGADFVAAIVPRSSRYCGIAYLPSGNGQGGISHYYRRYAVSLTSVSCGGRTMAHEMGHNAGLGHSVAQGSSGALGIWGRGHGVSGKFVTIMAYQSAYGYAPAIQAHSNPYKRICRSLPCGIVDSADAVRALNQAAPYLAAYYPPKVDPPVTDKNIVVNADFTNGLTGWAGEWGMTIERTAGPPYSLRGKNGKGIFGTLNDFEGGREFTVKATIRPTKNARSYVYLRMSLDGGASRYRYITTVSGLPGSVEKTFTLPAGKVSGRLLFYFPSTATDVTVNQISLEEK